jgi:hypothetical protein
MSDSSLKGLQAKITSALNSSDPHILHILTSQERDFLRGLKTILEHLQVHLEINKTHREGIIILLNATEALFQEIREQQMLPSTAGDETRKIVQQQIDKVASMHDEYVIGLFGKPKKQMLSQLKQVKKAAQKIDWLDPLIKNSSRLLEAIRCISVFRKVFQQLPQTWTTVSGSKCLRNFQWNYICSKLTAWAQDFKTPIKDQSSLQLLSSLIRDCIKLLNEANPISALFRAFDTLVDLKNAALFSEHELNALHELQPQIASFLEALIRENKVFQGALDELREVRTEES